MAYVRVTIPFLVNQICVLPKIKEEQLVFLFLKHIFTTTLP